MTIQLTSYPINAGNAWTFTALITAPDAATIYLGAIAYLIVPLNNDTLLANAAITPLTKYVTFPLTATTTANQFTGTGTLPAEETAQLLVDSADPLKGIKRQTVQLLLTAYTTSATPNPLVDDGDNLRSASIGVFPATSKSSALVSV